jgi:hypothetical protein
MSSCANIVNRLQSEVCLIKENWSYIDYSALILKMNQGIFFSSPLVVYIIPNTNPNVIGIPLNVEVSSNFSLTTNTYSALLITDKFGREPIDGLQYDSIVFTTEKLINYGQRTSSGFFEMNKTLPVVLVKADPSILPNLTYNNVISALTSCSTLSNDNTLTWGPYNALLIFLKKNYGITNISPYTAACFYDYFNKKSITIDEIIIEKEEPIIYLPVEHVVEKDDSVDEKDDSIVEKDDSVDEKDDSVVEKDKSVVEKEISISLLSVNDITSSSEKNTVSQTEQKPIKEKNITIDLYETCVERAYPFEPFEPFDPNNNGGDDGGDGGDGDDGGGESERNNRNIKVEKVKKVEKPIIVRHIEDSATTTSSTTESSSNDAIEAKLRALLEATETSEVTRTE